MQKQRTIKFRADIQGLRALAVIMVIIFHLNKDWLPGGFVGVDVFFVISGYLISGIIIKQTNQGNFNYYNFMLNRLKRIAPAYFIMLLGCLLGSFFILTHLDFETFLFQLRRTYVFLSNITFATGSDYFGTKTYENSLLHTWSLSIEMQFYLFLPLIFLLPRKIFKWLLLVVGIALLFYTEYCLRIQDQKQPMYFSLLARIPEFLLGTAIHFITIKRTLPQVISEGLSFIGLLLILLSAFFISENSIFPGLLSLPVCIGTAILLFLNQSRVNRFFGLPILVYIGELSYSLYLCHWPVLAFARYHYEKYDLSVTEILLLLPLIMILSLFSYYVVEQKLRHFSNRRIIVALGTFSSFMLISWIIFYNANMTQLEIERPYISTAHFDDSNHGQYSGYKLLGQINKEDDHILLIGDSHAFVMTAFFDKMGKKDGFNLSSVTTKYVPSVEGIEINDIPPEYREQYLLGVKVAKREVSKANIIFVVKHWYNPNLFADILPKLHKKLRKDQQLVIVSDFPRFERNPYRQYHSIEKPKNFIPDPVSFPSMPSYLLQMVEENENVHILDLKTREFFKNAPYYNDTLMYYDATHLNHYGSLTYADHVGDRLSTLINKLKHENKK